MSLVSYDLEWVELPEQVAVARDRYEADLGFCDHVPPCQEPYVTRSFYDSLGAAPLASKVFYRVHARELTWRPPHTAECEQSRRPDCGPRAGALIICI